MVSNTVHEQNHTHRFFDIATEPRQMLLPIQGYEKMPIVSLEEAVNPLVSLIPDIEQMVWIAISKKDPEIGLSVFHKRFWKILIRPFGRA